MKIAPIIEHPEYAGAQAELTRLGEALAKVRARLQEVAVLLAAPQLARNDSATLSAALAFAETGVVRAPSVEVANLHEEHQALVEQETALQRAMDRQRRSLDHVVAEASAQLGRDLRATHAGLAKRYLELLRQADQVLEEERQLVLSIEAAGYRNRLSGRILSDQLGRIGDSSGSVAFYLHRDVMAIAND